MFNFIKLTIVLFLGILFLMGCGDDASSEDIKTPLANSIDSEAPKITINGKSSIIITKGSIYTDAGATAKDNIDGVVIVKSSGNVDSSKVGTYNITYTAIDKAGNKSIATRTVNVVDETVEIDTTPPVITIIGDNPLKISQGETFSDPGATAMDDRDGTVTVTPSGTVDMSTVAEYTISYIATDKAGNEANVIRTVIVKPADVVWNVSTVTEFRQALENAASNGENDTIVLNAGIYKTTIDGLGTFDFNDNEKFDLTIESAKGLTYRDVILDGDNTDSVFDFDNNNITKDSLLTFKGISVINGKTESKKAGGINSAVSIKIEDCNISGNIGGGFRSLGYNTIVKHSIISNNKSTQSGGGFYSSAKHKRGSNYYDTGKTIINDSIIIYNQSSNEGGGFFTEGELIINNSTISNNKAIERVSRGGGFSSEEKTTIINSIISYNQSYYYGGGFYIPAETTIINSLISNNSTSGGGGGFYTSFATITNSNILNNQVLFAGTSYEGGGFYAATAIISDSNISNNSIIRNSNGSPIEAFGGGFYVNQWAKITNSTISNNSGGSGFACSGGYISNTPTIITTSVISNNTNEDNTGKAFYVRGKLILTNSIISNSQNGISSPLFSYISNNNFINIANKAIVSKGVFITIPSPKKLSKIVKSYF